MQNNNFNCLIANYVNEINIEIFNLKAKSKDFLYNDPLIAFRGEPKDYQETKLTPSLFRNASFIEKEKYLFELFCDYNLISPSASNIEKAIETQHFAALSRMLDITFNLLVAIYFACISEKDKDGYVYIFAFPEYYSPHSKYIEEFYTNILEGNQIAYSQNFKVFTHTHINERINAQNGGFIFFPGTSFYPINNCYYEKIKIFHAHKDFLLKELNMLFSINDASIFPQKDNIAAIIKEKFNSKDYSIEEVSVENEIKSAIFRLKYELNMQKKSFPNNSKNILRQIRKEESDLQNYIITNSINDSKKRIKLLDILRESFQILYITYQEV